MSQLIFESSLGHAVQVRSCDQCYLKKSKVCMPGRLRGQGQADLGYSPSSAIGNPHVRHAAQPAWYARINVRRATGAVVVQGSSPVPLLVRGARCLCPSSQQSHLPDIAEPTQFSRESQSPGLLSRGLLSCQTGELYVSDRAFHHLCTPKGGLIRDISNLDQRNRADGVEADSPPHLQPLSMPQLEHGIFPFSFPFVDASIPLDEVFETWPDLGQQSPESLITDGGNQREIPVSSESAQDGAITLLIKLFLDRLHSSMPFFKHSYLLDNINMRRQDYDNNFNALLHAICALTLFQAVQASDRELFPNRLQQAETFLSQAVHLHSNAELGENPTLENVLTSVFLFSCQFCRGHHNAARFRLREATALVDIMNLGNPQNYSCITVDERDRRLRTLLCLTIIGRYVWPNEIYSHFPANLDIVSAV